MKGRYITELSDEQIDGLSDGAIRELIRDTDLPLEALGSVSAQLDQLDRDTLVRLIYHSKKGDLLGHEQRARAGTRKPSQ